MKSNLSQELAALERMNIPELRARYTQVFGEPTNANNRVWLFKRIAWRLQTLAEGSLSERAHRRAEDLARDADLRMNPPKTATPIVSGAIAPPTEDNRVPPPGSVLVRDYKGRTLRITVLNNGFEFEGTVYKTLSALAEAITGSHCNGFHFFRLGNKGEQI